MTLRVIEIVIRRLVVFFFNDTATTEIYTLSLHDALPISVRDHEFGRAVAEVGAQPREPAVELRERAREAAVARLRQRERAAGAVGDRKSTRLNSVTPISRMPSSA